MIGQLSNANIYKTIHYNFPSIHGRFYLINEIRTPLGRLMAKINALNDGDGIIGDYFRNFHLSTKKSLQELTFLFHYVMSILENIVIALGGLMTTMGTLFDGFGVV